MSKTSKWIFFIEIILFAMPVYLLAFSFGLLSFGAAVIGNTIGNRVVEAVTLIFIFVSLWAFARLAYGLLFKSEIKPLRNSSWYWQCIYAVLIYTVIGASVSIWLQSASWPTGQEPNGIDLHIYLVLYSFFKWALFGIPMLVPGIHLVVMKRKFVSEIETNNEHS